MQSCALKALPSRAAAIAWLLTVLPATSLALGADAPAAACSRPLTAAASPIGRSMMISSAGEVTGVVRDVFDLVSLRSGCKIEYIVVPRARAHHLFRAASIDLMAAVTRTPERDDAGDFVQTHQVRAMSTPPSAHRRLGPPTDRRTGRNGGHTCRRLPQQKNAAGRPRAHPAGDAKPGARR
ncbi:MAG: transporter substrate-binding domain-containing protein [Pseudomonadota bacterium]